MNANDLRENLTLQDIETILNYLGGEPKQEGNILLSRTVCHNHAHEGKHKLYYYPDSKSFQCYTGCGHMDIFGLIMKSLDVEFPEAFRKVAEILNISLDFISFHQGFGQTEIQDKFYLKFQRLAKSIQDVIDVRKSIKTIDSNIINKFYPFYHKSWIDDNISIPVMRKFEIKYSIENNQIIIPHKNINGDLLGIRARNLNEAEVEAGRKYIPITYKKKLLNHATGANLYGVYENKECINSVKTIILMESEKGVLQLASYFPDFSVAVGVSGSNLTKYQLDIIRELDVEEVVIALDKEFESVGTNEEVFYAQKIKKAFVDKLKPYFKVSVIWDTKNLLNLKDSPTDKGKEVFQQLFRERIFL